MHNPSPEPPSHTAPATASRIRRDRPPTGIGIPTTLWLAPLETEPENPRTTRAVLPDWALRRAVEEYSEPGARVVTADTRSFYAGRPHASFRPLPDHRLHTPSRTRRQRTPARLAVLEVEILPRAVIETDHRGTSLNLITDFLQPALHEAAGLLETGGVLAIALSAPEPGQASRRTSIVVHLAHEAGFAFQQHIAIVTAHIDGDRLIPRVTDAQAHAVNTARRRGIPAPVPAHLDLAVFTRIVKEPCA